MLSLSKHESRRINTNRLRQAQADSKQIKMIETKTIPDFSLSPHVDQVGIEERASRFTKRSIKNESKQIGRAHV